MKFSIKSLLLTLTGLLISGVVYAQGNSENGQKLFTEAKCNQCHGTEVYTRKDRKISNLAGLEGQVRRCDSAANTNWFDDEIHDVKAYLNKQYYKF